MKTLTDKRLTTTFGGARPLNYPDSAKDLKDYLKSLQP